MIVNKYVMEQQLDAMLKSRHGSLTVSTSPTPLDGCCNFFDRCTDELMSLHFAGSLPLLDWIGFDVDNECNKVFEFITYVRPARSEGSATVGYLSNACADPNGWEFGTCTLTISDFGRYGRLGPTRDVMKPEKYCKTDPVRRLDGSVVTSEDEWDMRFTTDVIIQDLSSDLIVGNKTSNPGQIDGLEQLVSTGYSCAPLDSIVVNWNSNAMSGGAGVTWNGAAVASTYDFIDVLKSTVRRIRQRMSWSPMLRNQSMNMGDMVLVMPTHMAECLLDFYTCWSVCAGSEFNEVALQSYEARAFRDSLRGGLFGYGTITIDQMPIPILAYDWELIKTPSTSDIYLLTRGVGSMRMWHGEHLSAQSAVDLYGGSGFFTMDGGRILAKWEDDNECVRLKEWIHPRIYTRAPWANVRFQNVACTTPGGPLSPDPEESSFYFMSSFTAAACA